MTEERARRKLSGILSADAVGYSRLMEEDETSTIRNLTAQLIDALTGRHLWAEHYDRLYQEIFKLQDKIILKILKSLRIKLLTGEETYASSEGTNNLEAYLKILKSYEYAKRQTKEGNIEVRKLSKEASHPKTLWYMLLCFYKNQCGYP